MTAVSDLPLVVAGKFHGISSLLNLVGLAMAVGHGWWLAARLSFALV